MGYLRLDSYVYPCFMTPFGINLWRNIKVNRWFRSLAILVGEHFVNDVTDDRGENYVQF